MAHDVFLSYSSKDKPIADAVCATLEGQRIRCWIAPRDVLPGLPYGEALVEAIESSRLMVLLFSASANKSPQVMREVERAVSKGISIIPFRIEDVTPSKSLEYFISSPHWLDALTPPLEKHLHFLAETVQLLLVRHGKRSDARAGVSGPSMPTVLEVAGKVDRPSTAQIPSAPAAPQVKQPSPTTRAAPAAMSKNPSGQRQSAPLPVVQETRKTAHPKRSRKWLAVSLAVGLLLVGLLGLILIVFALSKHSPQSRKAEPTQTGKAKPSIGKDRMKEPSRKAAISNSLGMKFAWCPPGTFQMGSPPNEEARRDPETQHKVTLTKGFYLGVHEVTQAQWRAVMGNNPSKFKGDNLPVENVSWEDCQEFCTKLGQRDGKRYRLPTEAEWEYACRAGTTTPFSFGDTISTDQANYDGNYTYGRGQKGVYRKETTAVGSFPPNAWGLYDMHGNVWEWCQDGYGPYSSEDIRDSKGSNNDDARVLRGGSWCNSPRWCRAAYRNWREAGCRIDDVGCRVVLCLD